jgi:hypothetical protein
MALALPRQGDISPAIAWLRSPIFYGIVLLCAGAVLRAILAVPESFEAMTPDQARRALEYQRAERPILSLEARYRPYAFAFLFSASAAEMEAVKRRIDAELAEAEAVKERGLAGVPEYAIESLGAPDIVLMALGAALVFRGLPFVLAIGFGIGGFHQMMMQSGKLTGAPSEFYLADILAALAWCAAFWLLRALYEGRLRT